MQKQVWYFHCVFPFDFINENIFSTTVTYPLDLIKGRLQIQGEIAFEQHAKNQTKRLIPNRGMFGTAVGIGKMISFWLIFSTINPSLFCFPLRIKFKKKVSYDYGKDYHQQFIVILVSFILL